MSSKLIISPEQHVNPYEQARREHEPQVGDVYADKNPCYNGSDVFRLVSVNENGTFECIDVFTGEPRRRASTYDLKQYYVWIQNGEDYDELHRLARMLTEGKGEEVARMITGKLDDTPSDSQALMATESPEHIAALLDTSERLQNKMEEVRLIAKCMVETRKREVESMLKSMDTQLGLMRKKVNDLIKVITVLNLYTGNTVDVNQVSDGEPAPPEEPLTLRQRILFMDEELCVHLDHEADYQDIPAFFQWLQEPKNRDIIVPENRCVVCLKPKRFNMEYRSGDHLYDKMRNEWNKHTYVVLRNGEKLFWFESEDLEVYDWTFPHEDLDEKFFDTIQKNKHMKESVLMERDHVLYRTTKYMMFLQGLFDQRQDIIGPLDNRPNLMKLEGVSLVRDDENLIGTGRLPWKDFKKLKNESIRRGTRILYVAGRKLRDGAYGRPWYASGEHIGFYRSEYTEPPAPETGIYHADTIEMVDRHENGKPVKSTRPWLIFRYNPGDKVFDHSDYDWEGHERKKKIPWKFDYDYVLNYDAVTIDELRSYLEDRSLRKEFRDMMPMLKKILLMKEKEKKDEIAFHEMMAHEITKELGNHLPNGMERIIEEEIDEAISWWKEKVIFTRPLTSDDAKAFRMIKRKISTVPEIEPLILRAWKQNHSTKPG